MFVALLSLLLAGAPDAVETQPAGVPAKAEKKVCKRFGSSESRMGSNKVCKTAAEWKRMEMSGEHVEVKHDRSGRSH